MLPQDDLEAAVVDLLNLGLLEEGEDGFKITESHREAFTELGHKLKKGRFEVTRIHFKKLNRPDLWLDGSRQ